MAGPTLSIPRDDITGVILCGGRASRMGGIDKGWVMLNGQPLVEHARARLAPQVGSLIISANRHITRYAALAPVVTDALPDYPGPLAGVVAALRATKTRYLACVPCDVPALPEDLVERLSHGLMRPDVDTAGTAFDADATSIPMRERMDDRSTARHAPGAHAVLSVAATVEEGMRRVHPVCALMDRCILDSSEAWLHQGERRMMSWLARHNARTVDFADFAAFYNINTRDALDAAGRGTG
ncbi:molybdenum cofactor guanylyltransferase [Robbsia andropogonis]|uniref:molybdenum cofactor guanylyltransferase n=1 Tax=Robbsia andropogonis TaxID=28092 RepID=UPI0004BB00AC|nr:molybdenum cofactor guanylyltransferase [Robbsia andropogonis]